MTKLKKENSSEKIEDSSIISFELIIYDDFFNPMLNIPSLLFNVEQKYYSQRPGTFLFLSLFYSLFLFFLPERNPFQVYRDYIVLSKVGCNSRLKKRDVSEKQDIPGLAKSFASTEQLNDILKVDGKRRIFIIDNIHHWFYKNNCRMIVL